MTIRNRDRPRWTFRISTSRSRQALRRVKAQEHRLGGLKVAIRAQLQRLVQLNRTRADFAEKFEALIESFNAGSRSIAELFEELVKLSRNLSEEQQRHVRGNMTEEELVIFDILTRPAPELSTEERAEVKKVARELLNRLKQLLVLNWRQRSTARSQLKISGPVRFVGRCGAILAIVCGSARINFRASKPPVRIAHHERIMFAN